MKIRAADTLAIRRVALHMRERDFLELSAALPFRNRQELAEYFTEAYHGRGDIQAFCDQRGNPVAIFGALMPRPGVLSLLMFATPEICTLHLSATRWLRKVWLPAMAAAGIHRIDAISLAGYHRMHRWIEASGLRRESVLAKFGRGGQDFVMFAWTAA